jgi:hypothetical protein
MDEMPYDWWDEEELNTWLNSVSMYGKGGERNGE